MITICVDTVARGLGPSRLQRSVTGLIIGVAESSVAARQTSEAAHRIIGIGAGTADGALQCNPSEAGRRVVADCSVDRIGNDSAILVIAAAHQFAVSQFPALRAT